MEGNDTFDAALLNFSAFAKGMVAAEPATKTKRAHPLFVKTSEIAPNPTLAAERIAKQLNTGVMGIAMVGVESAEEVRQGVAAMRFQSKGGTRPANVGDAPAAWGLEREGIQGKSRRLADQPKG